MRRTLTLLTVSLLTVAIAAPRAMAQQPDSEAVEREMTRLLNLERVQRGLPELKSDPHLVESARAHARRMAEQGKLAHDLPGEPELSERISATGLRFNAVAENVSFTDHPDAAESSHEGLMESPPHRANILSEKYNAVGVGVVRRGSTYWITQNFARAFAPVAGKQVEEAVAQAVARLRAARGLPALRRAHVEGFERIACSESTTVRSLLRNVANSRSAVVYTTWTPERLPPPMASSVDERGLTALAFQVCPVSAERGGAGAYKIAAVFF